MFTLSFVGNDTIDYSLYPNKEYQLEWLRMYLKEVAKIKGNQSTLKVRHILCYNT